MSLKEKLLKILCFIPKMYFMLFNFIVDGDTRKFVRFMTHGWSIIIICFLLAYLRTLISYMTRTEPLPNDIALFVIIGLLFPVIFVLWLKYFVIRFLGRGTFESPNKKANEKVSYNKPINSDEKVTYRTYERKD